MLVELAAKRREGKLTARARNASSRGLGKLAASGRRACCYAKGSLRLGNGKTSN